MYVNEQTTRYKESKRVIQILVLSRPNRVDV